ncbi:DUF397 domain-containing protein [Streptomyces brevispora]|uniref:DUF397 domain-containing protein n=1 Tax=Streptomyces brevispora TaxID=887462 RepID=UPI003812A627
MSTAHDLPAVAWRKSSYSNGEGGACLEVADGLPSSVPVRDSKIPSGHVLLLTRLSWSTFVDAVKSGSVSRN